jgi:hypothetical protein
MVMGSKLSSDLVAKEPNQYNESDQLEQYNESDSEPNIGVLLISTHGSYEGNLEDTSASFEVPMEIKKIDAVTLGTCNFLSAKSAHQMIVNLMKVMKKKKNITKDITKFSHLIRYTLKTNDTQLRESTFGRDVQISYEEEFDRIQRGIYTRHADKSYGITSVRTGGEILEKRFTVYPEERIDSNTPYFDTATLLNETGQPDLVQIIRERTNHGEFQDVLLSELVNHVHEKTHFTSLIIIDLSCSGAPDMKHRSTRWLSWNIRKREALEESDGSGQTKKRKTNGGSGGGLRRTKRMGRGRGSGGRGRRRKTRRVVRRVARRVARKTRRTMKKTTKCN